MQKAAAPVSDDLKDTLRWATESLRAIYGPRLKRLILFGSQARGEAEPESDVDVLVVLEEPNGAYEETRRTSRVATHAAAYRDTALSFVHMSEEEFARARSPLVWSVGEDGIDLLDFFAESASPEVRSFHVRPEGPRSSEDTPELEDPQDPEDAVQALREKARAALSDAEVLLERGSPEATINRG